MGILDSLKNALGVRGKDTAKTAAPGAAPAAGGTTYVVQSGDTLWRIARSHYGDGDLYLKIFETNRGILSSPDRIEPGQTLVIPPRES